MANFACVYTCTHVYLHVHVYVHIYVCVYACICVCVHSCDNVYVLACVCVCVLCDLNTMYSGTSLLRHYYVSPKWLAIQTVLHVPIATYLCLTCSDL